jgi:UDPglucose 6-dehydrogenase/GDP-mannose 6-dehydrogenase
VKLAVVGVGYVGSVTAAGLAAAGHEVVAYDIDRARAAALAAGHPPVHEPGLVELIARAHGRLRSGDTTTASVQGAAVAFVCVPTPALSDGSIDTSYVESAVREIAEVPRGPLIIAVRSTVVPGTTDRLDTEVLAPARAAGRQIEIVANPEFLRESRAVSDYLDADRIVVGSASQSACELMHEVYGVDVRFICLSRSSAELAKYTSNALLATLISFSNELADLAETVDGADVADSLRALQLDRRWTEDEGDWRPAILRYLWPGCGYGGSCLPKDVKALVAEGRRRGVDMPLLAATDAINDRRAAHVVDRIAAAVTLGGARVAVLGTAFKENTQDIRDSPGLRLADELRARGALVATYDPLISKDYPAESSDAVLASAEVCVVVTWAPEFSQLVSDARARGALIVDARRQFAPDPSSGDYLGIGVGMSAIATEHSTNETTRARSGPQRQQL